ncbi:5-(carboxyamino)imidazole ribonucleotide synthase [Lutibaculum baratangense]|uniref:N5-carboxyaminoimidazole ribonucleotide synthase n=1 Tax=Lutibaculum baratangense AMV1 TaxID=631454 RepID=V4RCJ9_9HYPH|nr:5-(carboxyamino)imidazole ribonucleotide synthase [Lutibaculum baratangense]ESR23124.1 Phosphoribosylaminoimidazole carboxylase ATPase subunit [Lutibaculum baratangense AMV1]
MSLKPLPPGSTVGILGGGQLGRMLAIAAAELGFRTEVLCPDPGSPAFQVASAAHVAAYEDEAALRRFAEACDVVTFEFENVPARAVEVLEALTRVCPSATSLAVCQDRGQEKELLDRLRIPTAAWALIEGPGDIQSAAGRLGRNAVLKSRRFGYDGKGQARLDEHLDAAAAWRVVGAAPAILEERVPFLREVSVIGVRGGDGSFAAYDVAENRHEGGILVESRAPARLAKATAEEALSIARRIMEALEHVGVMGIEMFVTEADGGERLLVNELAPRVHNTGHWTQDGCIASQFEAHIRAVADWPLPSTARHSDAVMANLIGADADAWPALAAETGLALHLYGKSEVRPGRKMGHATRILPLGTLESGG